MEHLKKQVEKIIDEGEGPRRSVIVQLKADPSADRQLLEIAATVHRRRNVTVSARELLPAPRQELEMVAAAAGGKSTAATRRILSSSGTSLALQLGTALAGPMGGILAGAAVSMFSALLASDVVQKSIAETLSKHRPRNADVTWAPETPPQFASSRSMVLELHKDELAKLPDEPASDTVQDIFINRTLKLPSLVEVKSVPPGVQDEKGSSWGVNKINALAVWGAYSARGKGVKVAVLDTGVDDTHPDLKDRIEDWVEFDRGGFEVPNSVPHDTGQHGTHCAGTIAGGRSSGRWIGVAPDAKLAVALVLPKGIGSDAQILAGLEWAIRKKVDIISVSLGALTLDVEAPDPYTRLLVNAIAAGIPVITAIGNDGSQTTGTPGNDWFAFSVGATDYRDRSAGFSGGRTHIIRRSRFLPADQLPLVYSKPEVSAPGVAIHSSVPGERWSTFNGTSMATPHVAGALALLLSATSIKEQVADAQRSLLLQDLLTGSVEELGEAGQDHRFGFGRIDALRAIGFAKELGY